MKTIFVSLCVVLLSPTVGAQQNLFSKHYNLECRAIIAPICGDGLGYISRLKGNLGFLSIGSSEHYSDTFSSAQGMCYLLFDQQGDTVRKESLNIFGGYGGAICQSKDSSTYCIITGTIVSNSGARINLIYKFSQSGRLLWQKPSTPGLFPGLPLLSIDRMLPFGETGLAIFMSNNDNMYMVHVDSSGALVNTFMLGPRGRFTYAEPTPTGGYLLSYRNGVSNWAMETDSAFQVIWETEMYRPRYTNGINEGAMLQTPDGGYYHIFNKPGGNVQGQTLLSRAIIRKFDRFFQEQWLDSSESTAYLPGYVQQDGTLLVLTRRLLTPHVQGQSLRVWKKFRSNGSLEWEKLLDGRPSPQRDEYEYYHGIHLGNGDGVFVGTFNQGNTEPFNTGRDFLITRMTGVGLRFDPRTRVTSLSAKALDSHITCSPNPGNGLVHWYGLPPGRHQLLLTNAKGQTVYTQTVQPGESINLSDMPAGIYHWQLPGLGAKGKWVRE